MSGGAARIRSPRAPLGCGLGLPARGKTLVASGVFALKNTSVKVLCLSAGGAEATAESVFPAVHDCTMIRRSRCGDSEALAMLRFPT